MKNFPFYPNNEIKYLNTEIPRIKKKMNLIFRIDQGKTRKQTITLDYGSTIYQALTKFLETIGRPDLIGENEDKIYFIYSANNLHFWDQRRIENVFINKNPLIDVFIRQQQNNDSTHQSHYGMIQNIHSNKNSQFIHNNFNQISQFQSEIGRLNQLLNEEKEKNKILTKENYNLGQKIEFLNFEIAKLKSLGQNQNKSRNYTNTMDNEFLLSQMKPGEKILAVNFVSMGVNDIGHYNVICKNTDLFVRVEERLYNDFPQFKDYETFFNVKGKRIKRFKTIADNEIKNNDVINIFINDS